MYKKKLIAYGVGSLCAVGLLCGVLILLFGNPAAITSGIVVICLSICFGILVPNPICFWTLIAGICMLVFPTSVTGIILITLSAGSALANYIGYRKLEKQ